ncbi:MAG TPA: Hsp70 family protein [Verrucomicrobiae bacterium]|jgi:molecular chaperone DnaK|nr:Hsp70 family protein [Verrucomicrobiae bacterium]
MSKIVGIDLGTTNSLVATVDSGIPYVIADADGRRLTPSVAHFPAGGGEPVVGEPANRVRAVQPERTAYSIKRFMGRRGAEIAQEEMVLTYAVRGAGDGPVTALLGDRAYSPEEISAEILKKLKRDAAAALGEEVSRAVITVPAYFNDAQRNATKRAGELAGFTVERIVNEPTAAALAYGLNRLREKSKIAVYDLGGGTFDLSILELNEGVFQVLSTNGNTRLGGDDIDARISEFLAAKIKAAGGPEAAGNSLWLARIREAAEKAKIDLSTAETVEISLPFLAGGFHFQYQLTRAELESLAREIIARTRAHCLRALADAKLAAKDLDQVALVGGQTRMPLVRRMVAEIFGCAEFSETRGDLRLGETHHKADGPLLNTSQNPDEAVALGAAIQAEILSGGFRDVLLLDITPLSLGIETFGGLMNVIIPRNSTIPIKAGEMFTTAVDYQTEMLVHVLQGERERSKDNWSLGQFTLDFEPAAKGVPRLGVQFEIDANGILHVLARDTRTGRQKIVPMKSAVDVADADVQKMVEESVEHAFDDLRARQWVEAKLRADETLAATRKGLADADVNNRETIELAMRNLESALAAEGDVAGLKAAIAALDEATRPLAELLMDRAMEAMLQRKLGGN